MGQTILSFDRKTCFDQKTKLLLCFLSKILLKEKLMNQIKSNQLFCKKKKIKTFLKGQYGSNHIVPNPRFC